MDLPVGPEENERPESDTAIKGCNKSDTGKGRHQNPSLLHDILLASLVLTSWLSARTHIKVDRAQGAFFVALTNYLGRG